MFGFDEGRDNYNQVYQQDGQQQDFNNQSSFGHEVIAGGAAFAGFKAFEDHQRKEGKPVSHQFAKELLAGFAGAEVDKLAETKGEDFYDRERAKHQAKENAERLYDQHYGQQGDQYDPQQMGAPHHIREQFGDGYHEGGRGQWGDGGGGYGGNGGGYGGNGGGYGGGGGY